MGVKESGQGSELAATELGLSPGLLGSKAKFLPLDHERGGREGWTDHSVRHAKEEGTTELAITQKSRAGSRQSALHPARTAVAQRREPPAQGQSSQKGSHRSSLSPK